MRNERSQAGACKTACEALIGTAGGFTIGLDIVGDARHDMGVTPMLNNSTTLAALVSQLYRIRPASPTRTAGFFMRQPKPKTNSV